MNKGEQKKTNFKKFQLILLGLNILFVTEFLFILFSTEHFYHYLSFTHFLLFIILYFAITFLAKHTHELGHFVLGKLIGYQLIFYRNGIFEWRKQDDKLKLAFYINPRLRCCCYMLPKTHQQSYKLRMIWYSGGMIMDCIFLAAIFCFLLFTNFYYHPFIFFLLATANLVYEVHLAKHILPYTDSLKPTDGEVILGLIHQDTFAKQILALDNITIQLTYEKRPRDIEYDKQLFESSHNGFQYFSYILFVYYKALDSNDTALMQSTITYIEAHIQQITVCQLPIFYYELVYYYSAIKLDIDKAQYYYQPIKTMLQLDQDINGYRVLGSYEYFIKNNKEKALECIAKSIISTKKFTSKGQLMMEKDLIAKLQRQIVTN
ncbi:hypothetical protein RBG61_10885 [Paludicola sp. MB14-C6]|uniref:hypothetical protein n=1 Tax=Paludihabitans sp. MB14-C6 TaxID=3070656 RepID=UPI0027DD237F|nr:hypothetical protein [Paludicola sp. MB14-C6]WMJ22488.1 hypothetical protein RBG61_10885 [Paludicola sp. MB14-C6]